MFDIGENITVSADRHPIRKEEWHTFESRPGSTIAEIVAQSGVLDDVNRFKTFPTVLLVKGSEVTPVPLDLWGKVRPKVGTRVEITFPMGDPGTIALVAAAALPHAATATATALFTAGTLAYSATVAAVTIVGGLLINALIPPAQQGSNKSGPENFAITGLSNAVNRYGAYPYVLGRHQLFPVMTAAGFSETIGRDIYYRGRMTFGYGPVALETLKIGTTPIWEYDGVELEFLNVDETRTLANMPELANLMAGKSKETLTPKHRLGIGEDNYVYKPNNALKQVSITLAFGTLWFYDSFNISIDVSTNQGSTWTQVQNYATRSTGVTWTSGEFSDGVVRWYRVRVNSAVKSGDEEARRHGRQYSERPTVSKIEASMQGTSPSWRYGAEKMTLYSDDVAEDAYSDVPQENTPIIKYTRDNTVAAALDLTFPQGLYRTDNDADADRHKFNAEFKFEYQSTEGGVNEADWIDLGNTNYQAKVFTSYRVTKDFTFPEPGEYAIRITRITYIDDQPGDYNSATLTAIRSIGDREVPSFENIAEVAFRIKATEQLNGVIDNLNGIVQQLAPVWNGTSWTDPQPVRHPAWLFAQALRGSHLRRPVADDRLLLTQLKAWADEEPHWTCDYVVDTDTQLGEVLDIICAAGRAKKTLLDFKWSIIRDQAQGAVRQVFTPRNSWGYSAKLKFPRKIDGFRTMVRSERLEWQQDEILVLNDNVTAETAVELEQLELPGVVVTADEEDEGNAYRLARYHLAVALNRVEEHSFYADWESMRITRGDKILLIHDVPMMGLGQGRITEIVEDGSGNVASIKIDNALDLAAGTSARVTVRNPAGLVEMTAASPADINAGSWTVSTTHDASTIDEGDLVVFELTEQISAEMLVTHIEYSDDESALIKATSAVPAILDAATAIPAYNPVITDPRQAAQTPAPPKPVVKTAYSDERTQLIDSQWGVVPRAVVELEPFTDRTLVVGARLQLRWRETDSAANWEYSQTYQASEYSLLTGPMVEGLLYDIEVICLGPTGSTMGWVQAATGLVADSAAPDAPAINATFTAASVKDDTGTDRRPAIQMTWVAPFRGAAVVAWRIRVQAAPDVVFQGEISDVQALEAMIVDSVLPNTTYECQASFVTAAGAYSWSAWQTVTTGNIKLGVDDVDEDVISGNYETPGVPTGLSITSTPSDTGLATVVVDWNDVTPATGYDLEITQNGGEPSQWRFYDSHYEDYGLPGGQLSMRVRAVNGDKVSAWSSPVAHTIATDTIPPAAPTGLEAVPGFGSVWLNWDGNTEADLSHYEVAERDDTTQPVAADVVASTLNNVFTRSGLDYETTKYYWVRAIDTSGNTSDWSEVVQATTLAKEAITSEDIQGVVDSTSFAQGITAVEIVDTLPTTGNFEGRQATLTTDGKLYRYHDGAWTAVVAATDITGQLADSQVAALSAGKITGQLTDSQLASLSAAKLTGQITNTQISDNSISTPKLQTGAVETAKLAAGAVTTAKLGVGGGGNLLANSRFWEGTNNWLANLNGASGNQTTMSVRPVTSTFSGRNYPTMQIFQNGTATGGYVDFIQNGYSEATKVNGKKSGVPVVQTKYYEVSVQVSLHRCTGELRIQWLDAAGNSLSFTGPLALPTGLASSDNPEVWPRYEVRGQAPAGAAFANFHLRKLPTLAGESDSYMFIHKPQLAETVPNASEPVPYSEGGTTVIDGGIILTDTIIARHILAGEIKTDHLAANSVTAGKILAGEVKTDALDANAVTTAKLAAGAVKADQIDAKAITASKLGLTNLDNMMTCGEWNEEPTEVFDTTIPSGGTIYRHATVKASGAWGLILQKDSADLTTSVLLRTPDNSALLVPVRGAQTYWVEVEARASAAMSAGFYARLRWYDAAGLLITGSGQYGSFCENQALTTGWTKFTSQIAIPSGVHYAGIELINHSSQSTAAWVAVDRFTMRRANAAELVVDGTIKANHIDVNDLVVTGLANINTAYIEEANISGTLSAAKITAGTALASSVTVSGTALSTTTSRAADPAARINAASTNILPGKITISGGTTLSDWRGSDTTTIAGGKIETGTVLTNKLAVGIGKNLAYNTEFSAGYRGWRTAASGGSGSETSFGISPAGSSWAGKSHSTLQIQQQGTSTDGYADVSSVGVTGIAGDDAYGVPVQAGGRYEVSARFSTHRCTGELRLQWCTEDGTTIGYAGPVAIPTNSGTSLDPEGWQRINIISTAPSNAAYARIHMRKLGTLSGTNSYMFIYQPMVVESHPGASEASPYSVGPYTIIDGGTLVTNSITAVKIATGTLTANEIIADGITRQGVAGSSQVLNNSGTWTTIAEFTLSNLPKATYLQGIVGFGMTTGPQGLAGTAWQFRVTVNGSTRLSLSYYSVPFLYTNVRYHVRPFTMQNVPAGDVVVKFQMVNMGGEGVEESNISAIAAMR